MSAKSDRELQKMVQSVMLHRGGWYDFVPALKRLGKKLRHEGNPGQISFAKQALRVISDERNLYAAMTHLWNHGGSAPGPDGELLSQLERPSERFKRARQLRDDIRGQTYFVGPYHIRKIAKASGIGVRKIAVQNLADKIVQRGAAQVLGAVLDPLFLPESYGYRPGRDRELALANAEHFAVEEGRPVWVCEDLRDAFDHVSLKTVMELVESYFPADNLLQLVVRLIRLDEGCRGLLQGSPLSPLLLNLFLHHKIDRPFAVRCPDVRLFRCADDILLLCKNRRQAKKARASLQHLVAGARMVLKERSQSTIADLRTEERITWLGYDCGSLSGTFNVRIAQRAVHSIQDKLRELIDDENTAMVAARRMCGWFKAAGPAYDRKYARQVVRDVLNIVKEIGLAKSVIKLESGLEVRLGRQRDWLTIWAEAHKEWVDRYMRRRGRRRRK